MRNGHAQPILRFEHVTVRLDATVALKDISFEVPEGGTRVVFGAAGSGKTVLLKTAVGLLRPESGRVWVFGQDISGMSEQEMFGIRSRIGVLFQEGGLFDSLNIEDNVAYPLANLEGFDLTPEQRHTRAEDALRFVELEHTLDKFPSELSGGMRRRVGIARAVVTEPRLVLYDSPTAGLDPITAYTIIGLIVKERDLRNTTTVMVTHRYQDGHFLATARYDQQFGETRVADASDRNEHETRFLVLREGSLVFEGTLDELEASADPYVSKFVRHEE